MNTHPECGKLAQRREEWHWDSIQDFLDWCGEQGYMLCEHIREWVPVAKNRNQLMHDYLGVDTQELERERREILAVRAP